MNNQEAAERIAALIDRHGMDEAFRILAGDPPSGCDQPLVGRHAERAGNQGLSDFADSPSVGRTEEGVKLRRRVRQWKREEAQHRSNAAKAKKEGLDGSWKMNIAAADVCSQHARELEADLRAEPLTKSEAIVVDRCQCYVPRPRLVHELPGWSTCAECHGWLAPETEESGACPPNAQG